METKKENNPWKFMIHDDGLLTLVTRVEGAES